MRCWPRQHVEVASTGARVQVNQVLGLTELTSTLKCKSISALKRAQLSLVLPADRNSNERMKMVPERELFIGGDWVKPRRGGRLDVINPFDSSVIGSIPAGSAEDVQVRPSNMLRRGQLSGLCQSGSYCPAAHQV